jgi:hypothetical protein
MVRNTFSAVALIAVTVLLTPSSSPLIAQDRVPTATLIPATTISLTGNVDSNSPLVWDLLEGRNTLFVLTSFNGWPSRHAGSQLQGLAGVGHVSFETPPPHGVWMEAIVRDDDGTWYGYYHNERPAEVCGETSLVLPRIGAARSEDLGATWEDLGVILEAPADWYDCDTANQYFVGGVGDFSVMLDDAHRYLYFFFSQYAAREETQGVAVGRMPWAFRDRPRGRIAVWWHGSTWVPARALRVRGEGMEYAYPAGVPIYRARDGWHNGQSVDAFWGPSVHWNTYLEQYVMLLNRASDASFRQEGIYVAFTRTLEDPSSWSEPRRLLMGGEWYPQVVGIEPGSGTDKIAGERARLFLSGRSRYFIQFSR